MPLNSSGNLLGTAGGGPRPAGIVDRQGRGPMAPRLSLPERRLDSVIQEIGNLTCSLGGHVVCHSSLPNSSECDSGVPAAVTTLSSALPNAPQACTTCVSIRR